MEKARLWIGKNRSLVFAKEFTRLLQFEYIFVEYIEEKKENLLKPFSCECLHFTLFVVGALFCGMGLWESNVHSFIDMNRSFQPLFQILAIQR